MTRSLVTGAGGFVGGHLRRHLARTGVEVRPVGSRRDGGAPAAPDLLAASEAEVAAALEGVQHVYFLAAIAHEPVAAADLELMQALNVEAPARWLAAADRAGVRHFIWLSSIKVLGDVSARPLEPGDPYRPGDGYARSKVEAERRLMDVARTGTALTVVRPPLVYGPGVRGNFRALLTLAAGRLPLPFGRATAPRSLVSVGNLCDLLLRIAAAPPAAQPEDAQVLHVTDGGSVTVAELVSEIRRLLGRSPGLLAVPPAFVRHALRLGGREDAYMRLFEPLEVNMEATRAGLGWAPPQTLTEALAETVTWLRTSR